MSIRKFWFIPVFLIFNIYLFPQLGSESLKSEALKQMSLGRYGEAIELINKYITANPQKADGYNIRGLSYEKRNQLEQAVYDFRNARKLAPGDKEINANLSRATQTWYDQMYLNIEGYRREIAINPDKAVNYLEIGKCYKNLGQWGLAEEWYDEYIKRETPSADEVIRFTEILAKNNHIEKGEKILKEYVEKYPRDHRLWSRYGYFTLWLGKTKIAIEAFVKALELRPFFLEAEDGLRQAQGKGYVYSINDTSYNARSQTEPKKPPAQQEYAIDKYYRILKNNPDDDETRFALVKELKKVKRYEEAFQQLEILSLGHGGEARFEELLSEIVTTRDSLNQLEVQKTRAEYEKDPENKQSLIKLVNAFNRVRLFDESMTVLSAYFDTHPDETDLDLRFNYAQTAAWNKGYNVAEEQLAYIIEKDPGNLKFQLLGAQISAWTEQNLDRGTGYTQSILEKDPNNFDALLAAGMIEVHKKNFDGATAYVEQARNIRPNSNDLSTLELRIEFEKMRFEEEKLRMILEEGQALSVAGDCEGAIVKYDEYMSKTPENRLVQKEYADILSCAKQYDKAIGIFNYLLESESDFDIDFERAKTYLYKGDSLKAVEELERLQIEQPDNFLLNLFLGDAYQQTGKMKKARSTFERLQTLELDSTQQALVTQRISWLPVTGIKSFIKNFPSYFSLYPNFAYFDDNTEFVLQQFGINAELGVLSWMSFIAGYNRGQYKGTQTSNVDINSSFTSLYTGIYVNIANLVTVGGRMGSKLFSTNVKRDIANFSIRSSKDSLYSASVEWTNADATEMLYAKTLINSPLTADMYNLSGWYMYNLWKILANYKFLTISDGNKGEIYDFRIGRFWDKYILAGYEYGVTNFINNTQARNATYTYFSPQNFATHCIWGEYDGLQDEDYSILIGGKVGLIPESNYIISDFFVTYKTDIIDKLALQLTGRMGRTFRENTSYKSRSFQVQLTWGL